LHPAAAPIASDLGTLDTPELHGACGKATDQGE